MAAAMSGQDGMVGAGEGVGADEEAMRGRMDDEDGGGDDEGEYEYDDDGDQSVGVQLGLAAECPEWKLRSCFFPSKIGGKPAWLNLAELPSPNRVTCPVCASPTLLLAQVYAPFEEKQSAFHRTLFIWICPSPECWHRVASPGQEPLVPMRIFRCQMPRRNIFYSYDPPQEDVNWGSNVTPDSLNVATCVVCGARGQKRCGACKKTAYCSKLHQLEHWRSGHKSRCKTSRADTEGYEDTTLPEFELVMEQEHLEKPVEKTEDERMAEFQVAKTHLVKSELDVDAKDLEATAMPEDKAFLKFHRVIEAQPKQVLRYDRGGTPLWVSGEGIPQESDIHSCEACGGPRQFEFQLMPQLLNHLKLDEMGQSIDWGTLAVFTCIKSCDQGPAYKDEFVWKQDFSPSDRPIGDP